MVTPMTVSPDDRAALATLAAQVQYLIDRAAVSDALIAFAHAVDTRDWDGYADLYEPEGELSLPFSDTDGAPGGHRGRAGLAEYLSSHLSRFAGTQHMSTNHAIEIEGDVARTRSYCQCIHRLSDDDPGLVWEIGGWYDCELVRRPDLTWGFRTVRLSMTWENQTLPNAER